MSIITPLVAEPLRVKKSTTLLVFRQINLLKIKAVQLLNKVLKVKNFAKTFLQSITPIMFIFNKENYESPGRKHHHRSATGDPATLPETPAFSTETPNRIVKIFENLKCS